MLGKIIFFGTPDFAAGILEALVEKKFDVAAVFTQPDKKIGRKQDLVFSPVKKLAIEHGIKILQPESLKDIEMIEADLFVVAAYGKILPKEFLEIPKFGAINVHASLLPKYRGASPVQCAILAGEKETGVTLMLMNEKMDEGDILAQEKLKIEENETADVLMKRLENLGAKMVVSSIPDLVAEKIKSIPQDHSQASYCKQIKREDGKTDWNSDAREIFNQWRAYHPWPGIFSMYKSKRIKLLEVEAVLDQQTGEKPGKIVKYNQNIAIQAKNGLIVLKKIQLEGKKEMSADDFVRGNYGFVGSELK